MGLALHQTGHGHSHRAGSEEPNASVRAAFVHVVGDLLQSVGVLIASYIIYFKVWVVTGAKGVGCGQRLQPALARHKGEAEVTVSPPCWCWWGFGGRVMALEGPHPLPPLQPEYKYMDPICTFLFSALVLGTTLTIFRDIVLVLMEGRDPPGLGATHRCSGPHSSGANHLSLPRHPKRDGLQRRAGGAAGSGRGRGRAQPPHLGTDCSTASALRAHRHQ